MRTQREAANGSDAVRVACWNRYKRKVKESIMSDDLHNRGPQDHSRINLHEPWEVQYWTKTLGVSKEELERAVKSAGSSSVNTVRQHLTGNKH
jgi:hypothetical protein